MKFKLLSSSKKERFKYLSLISENEMNRVLSTVLTGILGITPATGLAQQQTLEDRIKVTSPLIETEIRKWGPWVEGYIESDYTDGQRTKRVSIYLEKSTDFLMSRMYGAFADYDPEKLDLRLPETIKANDVLFFQNAVHHELTHSLFGKNGLINAQGYSGPSEQELIQSAKDAMALPENQKPLKEEGDWFAVSVDYRVARQRFMSMREVRDYVTDSLSRELVKLKDAFKELEDRGLYNGQQLEKEIRRIFESKPDYVAVRLGVLEKYLHPDSIYSKDNPTDASRKIKIALNEEVELERILRGNYATKRVKEITELIRFNHFLTTLSIYGSDFDSREWARDSQNHLSFMERITKSQLRLVLGTMDIYDAIVDSSQPVLSRDKKEYVRNPGEFIARSIGRIATLDLSEISYDSPFVTDDMLAKFNRMTFNGERIFGDLIDRFMVARELIKRGHDVKQIPKMLEGNMFVIDGANYYFKGNNYTIIGIPRLEDSPK